MEQESLHSPDFGVPDFTQPALEKVDLALPGFVLPDPAISALQQAKQLPLWPMDMDRLATNEPDPALPDLLEPEHPHLLSYPPMDARLLPELENVPEVVMQQRPGELDPASLAMILTGPDEAELPPGLAYPQLYTNDDEMTWRKRHFALLELGLAQTASNDDDD